MVATVKGMPELERRLRAIGSQKGQRAMIGHLGGQVVREAKQNTRKFRKTGNLGRSITMTAVGTKSVRIEAAANYAAHVEYGTEPHVIKARRQKAMRWAVKGGTGPGASRLSGSPRRGAAVVYAKSVQHPGTKAQPFMRPALDDVLKRAGSLSKYVVSAWNRAA